MGRPKKLPLSGQTAKEPGYTFADVLVLTSATPSHLTYWTKVGIIKAQIRETAGRGYPQRFSAFNVIETELASAVRRRDATIATIFAALDAFRGFHIAMRAVHEVATKAPLVSDPPYMNLYPSDEYRTNIAEGALSSHARNTNGHRADLTHEALQAAAAHVKKLARIWAELRTGSLNRGIPSPSVLEDGKFLGLFLGSFYGDTQFSSAMVALDPPDLSAALGEVGFAIDLLSVVWQVGQRCKQLGVTLDPW